LFVGTRNGRKIYRQHTVHGSKRDAERERTRLLRTMDTGTYLEPSRQTVAEYLESWLVSYAKTHVSARTFERYTDDVRLALIPGMGHILLTRLSPQDIREFYAHELEHGRADGRGRGPLSATTVVHHARILHEALKHAVNEGLLAVNPADRVRPPRKAHREMAVLDQEQTSRLLEAAKGTRFHIPVLLAVGAGLRRGEIFGLRWRDVDLKGGSLSVQQTVEVTRHGLAFKPPKTPKSRRLVPLPGFCTRALLEHRRQQAQHWLRVGPAYSNHDLVCGGSLGMPQSPDGFSVAFVHFVRSIGLERPIRFHDLRHSHATLLLAHGVHPKVVSERLGHSTIGLTLDTYSHVLPGLQEHAAAILEEALGVSG
jgi:integrase